MGQRPPNAGKGRPKGVPNKATTELKALAQVHGPAAVAVLVKLMDGAKAETARIMAAKELLDRGYGRPPQAVTDADGKNLPMPTTVLHVHQH